MLSKALGRLSAESSSLLLKSSSSSVNSTSRLFKYTTTTANPTEPSQQDPQAAKPEDAAAAALLKEKSEKLERECVDLKDKYMRALAEAENTRIRMRKQVDDAKSFGIQGFCKDLLEVADILNMAVVNTDPAKSETKVNDKQAQEQLNAMFKGLVMTEKSLLKVFEKHGLTKILPKEGEKFDPNLHEAIFRMPPPEEHSDAKKKELAGAVSVCTKTGFKLHERVVRAAQVGVFQ